MHAIANYLHTPPPARRRRAATTRMAPAGVAILLTFYVVKQTKGWKGFFFACKKDYIWPLSVFKPTISH